MVIYFSTSQLVVSACDHHRLSAGRCVIDDEGGSRRVVLGVDNLLRKGDPLGVLSILLVTDVDVLNLDIALRPATLLPLGICAGLFTGYEGVIELNRRVP